MAGTVLRAKLLAQNAQNRASSQLLHPTAKSPLGSGPTLQPSSTNSPRPAAPAIQLSWNPFASAHMRPIPAQQSDPTNVNADQEASRPLAHADPDSGTETGDYDETHSCDKANSDGDDIDDVACNSKTEPSASSFAGRRKSSYGAAGYSSASRMYGEEDSRRVDAA
eukprot:6185578-Pleurochrysis_carterae.AAC.2